MRITHIATAGGSFCPEMGGSHDGSALFVASSTCDYIKWSGSRHAEALATFKRLRVRPRAMNQYTPVNGWSAAAGQNADATKWSAMITYEAFNKLRPLLVREALLD